MENSKLKQQVARVRREKLTSEGNFVCLFLLIEFGLLGTCKQAIVEKLFSCIYITCLLKFNSVN